ncbi:hypothetical protein KJ570_01580 [Patescibacteria group bacterium]|nr:hypothetical protein [Patescibacteria group bacterium]MBU2036257.1 hypothetical protein [Patescibacteria group bacterium]
MNNTEQKIKNLVIGKLAEHIGVETEDINLQDSLVEDLHLNIAEISDLLQELSEEGIEIEETNLKSIETVSDLIDYILSQPGII